MLLTALPWMEAEAAAAGMRRLLLVDDDPLGRGMAARTLRHAGFDVVEAADGEAALAAWQQQPADLVLLDLVMPDLDGYVVCSRLRALPGGDMVPILVMTGLSETEAVDRAYQAGATDFIAKPVHWALLAHRVRYALRSSASAMAAERARSRLVRAQRIANMGHWEVLLPQRTLVCSPEAGAVYAAPPEVMATSTLERFTDRVCAGDAERVQAARLAAARDGTPYQLSFEVLRFDGVVRTVIEQVEPVRDGNGQLVRLEGITQDITDRIEAERRITRMARYDALTGLPNSGFFPELVAPALQRSRRLGTACALLQLDVDRFKSVNDAAGRAAGDEVLKAVAMRLSAAVRSADLMAAGGRTPVESLVARVGGNAFTLLLVDVEHAQAVSQVVERLLRALAAPLPVRGHTLVLTACVGIAMFPRDARDAEGLSRCAEQALYTAKAAGRGQQRFFDEAMNQAASARLLLEADLREAITGGQLRLHYQPKFDAVARRIVGAEALVRWQHPRRGLVGPLEFIPLAEESGLIGPLTDWVLATACADQQRRLLRGLPLLPVAVNLAAPCFADAALPQRLRALLHQHGLQPGCLQLEVTETLLMSDVERAVQRLGALREAGFHIALDDFGTGYSSLTYLNRFPVDALKIDRSFITEAPRGGRHGAIAASIIALGRAFGLQVVAEGVETPAQAEFLVREGCHLQQGWLHGRPLPVADYDALLAAAPGRGEGRLSA